MILSFSDGGSSSTDVTAPLLSNAQSSDRINEPASSNSLKPETSISSDPKLNDEDMNVATDAVLIDINDAVNETQNLGSK